MELNLTKKIIPLNILYEQLKKLGNIIVTNKSEFIVINEMEIGTKVLNSKKWDLKFFQQKKFKRPQFL